MAARMPVQPRIRERVFLWPENVPAWLAFLGVQSQWVRVPMPMGMGGGVLLAVGLNYPGVRADLAVRGIRGKQLLEVWDGIKACERGAARAWADALHDKLDAQRNAAPC